MIMKVPRNALKRKANTSKEDIAKLQEGIIDNTAVKRPKKGTKVKKLGTISAVAANGLAETIEDAKDEPERNDLHMDGSKENLGKPQRFRSKEKILLLTARGISSRCVPIFSYLNS